MYMHTTHTRYWAIRPRVHLRPREVLVLLGQGDVVLWADASDDPSYLPDSRERWDAVWALRDAIVEIAHTHPRGPLAFSSEDETTMRAITSGLGRSLVFSVVAPRGMLRREVHPPASLEERAPGDPLSPRDTRVELEPWWAPLLRLSS